MASFFLSANTKIRINSTAEIKPNILFSQIKLIWKYIISSDAFYSFLIPNGKTNMALL